MTHYIFTKNIFTLSVTQVATSYMLISLLHIIEGSTSIDIDFFIGFNFKSSKQGCSVLAAKFILECCLTVYGEGMVGTGCGLLFIFSCNNSSTCIGAIIFMD